MRNQHAPEVIRWLVHLRDPSAMNLKKAGARDGLD
jgi:hypothetical protein